MSDPGAGRVGAVVGGVVGAGLAALCAVALLSAHGLEARRVPLLGGDVFVLCAVLLVAAAVSEVSRVSLRRGDETEDLTLFDAAVVACALLLPSTLAVIVPALGVVAGGAVIRRAWHKMLFNVGWVLAGSSVLVTVHAAIARSTGPFSPWSVLGVLLGAGGLVLVNLGTLALVLRAAQGSAVAETLAEGWRMSVLMAIGNGGTAMMTIALASRDPVLVPFAAVPVLALLQAYRSYTDQVDQRRRTADMLEVSAALLGSTSGREALTLAMPPLARALDAERVEVIVPGLGLTVAGTPHGGPARSPAPRDGDLVVALSDEGSLAVQGARVEQSQLRQLLAPITGLLAAAIRAHASVEALTEETAKLNAVIDNSTDAIVVWNTDGRVALWSPAAVAQTGYEAETVMALDGDPLAGLLALLDVRDGDGIAIDAEAARRAVQQNRSGVVLDVTLRRPDGEQRHVRVALAAATNAGEIQRIVAIGHDVTAQRRVDRMKHDFVATVSHELRTPITPIKGYAKLLATHLDQMAPERRVKALRLIEERADHLARIVDDLLLANRVAAGERRLELRLDEHDACELVRRAVDALPSLSSRIRVVVPEEPVPVVADATRVMQCLTNLLTNSEKYSASGTPIDVRVDVWGESASLAVTDRGRGIPADEVTRVFERFHRVEDSLTQAVGGSGLGLYVARELARAMHGDVTCTSRFGEGSTFTLRLPLSHPAEPSTAALAG